MEPDEVDNSFGEALVAIHMVDDQQLGLTLSPPREPWWVPYLTPAEKQFMYSEVRELWFENTQGRMIKHTRAGRPA